MLSGLKALRTAGLALLVLVAFCPPSWALEPTQVFSSDGRAGLVAMSFDAAENSLIVRGDAALSFQVSRHYDENPPSLVVHFFNAVQRPGFRLISTPVGPLESVSVSYVAPHDGLPRETRMKLVLSGRFRTQSALSPDTREAVIHFGEALSGQPPASRDPATLPREIVVRHLNYANASDVANILSMMVPQGNGKIAADATTNDLIIDNDDGQFDDLEKSIEAIDHPRRQVLLQAQVVEVNLDAARNLGLALSPTLNTSIQEAPYTPSTGYNQSGTQPMPLQSLVRTGVNLQATLNMLQSDGKAKILASPKVASLEGVQAKIVTGERIPYFVSQVSGNTVFQVKEDFLAGVELDITPQVNAHHFITAKIHTNVSTITGTTAQGYPQLSTREVKSVIRVAAGETIVIGGLLQDRVIENVSGIPYLSDLPILGSFFSTKQREHVKTELVIFITPYILSDE